MKGESFVEGYLQKSGILFYVFGLLFVLIALESRVYTYATIEWVNVSDTGRQLIKGLYVSRFIASILFVIIYLTLLVGGMIRAVIRFVEAENPIDLKTALAISAIATLFYYVTKYFGSDLVFIIAGPVVVDMTGVTDVTALSEALIDAYDQRVAAHPTAAMVVVLRQYVAIVVYFAIIRYLVYKVRNARAATFVVGIIFLMILVGALR